MLAGAGLTMVIRLCFYSVNPVMSRFIYRCNLIVPQSLTHLARIDSSPKAPVISSTKDDGALRAIHRCIDRVDRCDGRVTPSERKIGSYTVVYT
jgi:hypothetical protein